MRTISILGVVFLPGTFVAVCSFPFTSPKREKTRTDRRLQSILSTSFFDFKTSVGEDISSKFWIYWAITIPLTLIVLAAWIYWYQINKRSHEAMDRKIEESMPSAATRRVGTGLGKLE
jgi:hypothetical protein